MKGGNLKGYSKYKMLSFGRSTEIFAMLVLSVEL